jgi:ribonuclease BN (tRNA processing enzyme)
MTAVRVTFLGTGDAFCAGGLHHSGYFVQGREMSFLLDCGPSTLSCLKRQGLLADSIDVVLISHLHGDHFAGLPFLFLEYMYLARRRRSLIIAGPPGTEERVRNLFSAMYRHTAASPLPFEIEFLNLAPRQQEKIGSMIADPFPVPHQQTELSYGFRVEVDGRTIVYSGDTGWTEELPQQSQGGDLFICECSSFETRTEYHLDYPRLRDNRDRFGSRRMVLTHLGEEVLAHRSEIDMELADDGLIIQL